MIEYYAILELSPSASFHQIRSTYRRLAFRYHPDVTKVYGDVTQMQILNEAYAILGSPVRRAQYDFLRRYTDQPSSSRQTRSEPRSSSTAYWSNSHTGLFATQTQVSDYSEVEPQDDWVHGIMLFAGELIYHLIRDFFVVLLYLIPTAVYFYILGSLSVWISPELPDTSPFLMAELFIGSVILTYMTVWMFRKRILVRDFLHRIRF